MGRPRSSLIPANALANGMRRRIFLRAICFFTFILVFSLLASTASAALFNRKLSGEMPDSRTVTEWKLSPDGMYMVFIADRLRDHQYELFSTTIYGGVPIPISGLLDSNEDVQQFTITPDSQYVVFTTWKDVLEAATELWSVPIGGGTPVQLNVELEVSEHINNFVVSAQSDYVVYLQDDFDSNLEKLYSVGINADPPPLVLDMENCESGASCHIESNYLITPDGTRLLYSAVITSTDSGLMIIGLDGESYFFITLNPTAFKLTPDGSMVVFNSIDDGLCASDLVGGVPIQLAPYYENLSFEITPGSPYGVVYARNVDEVGLWQKLYSVPITGGTSIDLSGDMEEGGEITAYKITPNSLGVVYRANKQDVEKYELYSVWITGGESYKLSEASTPGGDVTQFAITPNSLGVVYIGNQIDEDEFELFAAAIDGSIRVQLSPEPIFGGNVIDFAITPNNLGVVYSADLLVNETFELFWVPTLGGSSLKLNTALITEGDVDSYQIQPDSLGVAYLADQEVNEKDEVYLTRNYDYAIYLPVMTR